MTTVLWQRIEGTLVFAGALVLLGVFNILPPTYPWWVLVLIFFAPDLSFAAYLGGPRVGAIIYNIVHLYGFGLCVLALAFLLLGAGFSPVYGLLWLGHAGFDRMLGYGLKEVTGFQDTHLGRIGRR